jgi:putative peptidoglycan lipid II flippase
VLLGTEKAKVSESQGCRRPMSENRRIVKAAGLIGTLTLCSRIAGLFRDAVIGYLFGTGAAADAFFVAFRAPNLLRRFVAEGAMGAAFVPVFSDYLARRGREPALEAARAVLGVMLVCLAVLVVTGILLAPEWVRVLAPGFLSDPSKLHMTTRLAQILFGYVFLISVTALLGGFLNAARHFAAPAASPILLNLAIIAAAVLLAPHLATPVYALGCGVLVGGAFQMALQFVPLLRHGLHLTPLWQPRHEAVGHVARRLFPVLIGAAVFQINMMMGTIFASVLPQGSVSYLWYADRVFEFPLGLVAVAFGTAALPSFTTQAARQELGELRRSLAFAIRITSFVAIPAAVGIAVLALPITTVLFRRGAFGVHEAEMTAWALRSLAMGLWPVSMAHVLVAAFYAVGDARTPALTACIGFTANAVLSLMLMGQPSAEATSMLSRFIMAASGQLGIWDLRHAGLALATSLAATVNLALLLKLLSRRLRGLGADVITASLARSLAAALIMAPPVWLVSRLVDWSGAGSFWSHTLVLLLSLAVGVGTFGTAAYALGSPEITTLRDLLRQRLGAAER